LIAPGAVPLRLVVPAFWTLETKYDPHWQGVRQADGVVSAVVIEASWPATAAANPIWKGQAQAHLDTLPGAVLGYIHTRSGPPNFDLLNTAQVTTSIDAWYTQFGGQIDGIYFDELILPEKLGDVPVAMQIVAGFKVAHPGAKAMILAGQCPDASVIGPEIDWALLWEDREPAYIQNFAARVGGNLQAIPSWWKDPTNRRKIVHVIHASPEPARQRVLGSANERNAGNVFVMDARGQNATGADVLYDHLPPYWDVEVREANSYYDFGFDPPRALVAASRYGTSQGKLHAWPNCEAAWYGVNHVRGTYLLDPGAHATTQDVALTNLASAALFDIPTLWAAAHVYARSQGYETALPTLEPATVGGGPGVRLVLFATGLPWLTPATVPLTSTYQQPTFAEPSSVVRNVHRWGQANGFETAFPTFVRDDPANPRGRTNAFNAYGVRPSAPVVWRDVPTPTYIQQL
jgi:hypothetical protein